MGRRERAVDVGFADAVLRPRGFEEIDRRARRGHERFKRPTGWARS
ncbi:hypothetical protein [Amycolatopsis sp.]|nr:hypothetical protein [Amycolatopsis sp.]HVV13365.1 hypothetical protein [Amycolatopsis sp.]